MFGRGFAQSTRLRSIPGPRVGNPCHKKWPRPSRVKCHLPNLGCFMALIGCVIAAIRGDWLHAFVLGPIVALLMLAFLVVFARTLDAK